MKKLLALLLSAAVLYSCAACSAPKSNFSPCLKPQPLVTQNYLPILDFASRQTTVFIPEENLTAQETIDAYFRQQYNAYTSLSYIDISRLLDTTQEVNQNFLVWLQTLIQRRRLLAENNLCYVETKTFPYTIHYEEQENQRMEFWQTHMKADYDTVYHLRIEGEPGRTYPPMMAVNAQHSIFLKKLEGQWKIVRHYYPGAVRSFWMAGNLQLPSEEEMLTQLQEEFAPVFSPAPSPVASGAIPYQPQSAVEYALQYTEVSNPTFYHIGDWMGNCANFVSQCVSAGFQSSMSASWYAGGGGGSPAWENVSYFWEYAVSPQGLSGQVLPGINAMQPGDILQTRPSHSSRDSYNHMLILIEPEKKIFAQNSPSCFVYYSDLVNCQTRILRPHSFFS